MLRTGTIRWKYTAIFAGVLAAATLWQEGVCDYSPPPPEAPSLEGLTLNGKKKPRSKKKKKAPPKKNTAAPQTENKPVPPVRPQVSLSAPYRVKRTPPRRSPRPPVQEAPNTVRLTGTLRNDSSYRLDTPQHFSKVNTRLLVALSGRWRDRTAFRVSGRFSYDSVFDITDAYPDNVKEDMQTQADLREAFLDFSPGPLEVRVGKQQIVWGEVIGAFVADQVNAKDYREFLLPDFETIRIPDWAADAEYSIGDFHSEFLWIPAPEFDLLPPPGSEFASPGFPPPGPNIRAGKVEQPAVTLKNGEVGARLNGLLWGLDVSGFALHTWDKSPILFSSRTGSMFFPMFTFNQRYERLDLYGGTFSFELSNVIFKGEMVYYNNRAYNTIDVFGPNSVIYRDAYDYVIGADYTWFDKVSSSFQYFVRGIKDYSDIILSTRYQSLRYASCSFSGDLLGKNLKGEFMASVGLNQPDVLLRPHLTWAINHRWQAGMGLNIFDGKPSGIYGQYDNNDSVTADLQFSF